MKKRILSIMLILCMVLVFMPQMAYAADPATDIPYMDASGTPKTCASATVVASGDYTWGDDGNNGWYVVSGNVTLSARVTVSGDVHLILKDGCTLNATCIYVDYPASLTIYGQGGGTGTLNAHSHDMHETGAAIGSSDSGYGVSCGNITINGGTVIAISEGGGAGIGGSLLANCGNITINGGTVTANGNYGAGIGGGLQASGGNITINGGTVTANSVLGAGIGGGRDSEVGGTFQTNNSNVVVFASSIADKSRQDSWQGIIFEGNEGKIYGTSATPGTSFTIPGGKTLTIASGQTLTIPENVTLTNNGTIINYGSINGKVYGNQPRDFTASVNYLDEDGVEKTVICTVINEDSFSNFYTLSSGWYVVSGNVSLNARVTVSGDVHLILADGCEFTVNGGIEVSTGNSLTIYAQSTDANTGKLIADASSSSVDAGIGGTDFDSGGNCGTITINGGTVTATSEGGAGIGGGYGYGINGGSGGTITINGGTVTATSERGAGIGGSCGHTGGSGGNVTISGGTVTATSQSGAGIGGGYGYSIIGGSGTFQIDNGNAVVFASSIADKSKQSSWNGIIFEGNAGKIYGSSVTPGTSFTIPDGKTLTIESGQTLTIPESVTLTNNGIIRNNGTIYNKGTIINNGTVTGNQPQKPLETIDTNYLDENGEKKSVSCTVINADNIGSFNRLSHGWYVVKGTVTANKRIRVSGDVHLILADGCEFTGNDGIAVGTGDSLKVYAQSTGDNMGKLTANTKDGNNAGIGGSVCDTGGSITIIGGTVTAKSSNGAGIGGGAGEFHDNVFNGGDGGEVIIKGGTVMASSQNGAGIGGGSGSKGNGGDGGEVIIKGGTVMATSRNGEGIGGGSGHEGNADGDSGIFQTNNGNAVVFASSIADKSSQSSWNGVIFEGSVGKVYGTSVTPIMDFTIDGGKTLLIPESSVLTISGITTVNNGSVYVDGTVRDLGGDLYYPLTVNGGTADKTYTYNSKSYGKAGEVITLTGTDIPEGNKATWTSTPSVEISDGSFIMPNNALKVTAQFIPLTYTITFNTDGGTTIESKTGVKWTDTVLDGVPDPAKEGWEFTGWKCQDEIVTAQTTCRQLVSSDMVSSIGLTAQWKDVTTPVISGIEDGKIYCSAQTVSVSDNDAIVSVTVNGTEVALDANNQFTLNPAEGTQTIIVTDKAGNQTSVSVTVNDGHTYGKWQSNGDGTHTRHCTVDGCNGYEDGNCAGGTATCKAKAICGYCGSEYGEIDSSNHNLEKILVEDPTDTETGNKEYWYCLDCGKYFADENGTTEIKPDNTVTQELPPAIIEGKGQSITAGEKTDLTFRSNAAFGDFIRAQLDGKTLDEKNYIVKEGSTIVTLKADYVATLSAGEHTIGIVSTNGTAETTFTVASSQKPAGNNPSDSTGNNPNNPTGSNSNTGSVKHVSKTGDNSHMALWIALMLISGILLSVLGIYGKKKKIIR